MFLGSYGYGLSLKKTESCIEALKGGLGMGTPELINSDQGCQFTSDDWVNFL